MIKDDHPWKQPWSVKNSNNSIRKTVMTKEELEAMRNDAIQLVLMKLVDALGPKRGRGYIAPHMTRIMDDVRGEVFGELDKESPINKMANDLTRSCLDNIFTLFEGMLLFKESANVLDLMYLGLKTKIKGRDVGL